ncbi:MAG: hypothetical protein ABIG89_04525 [Candidatus Woesearchaeota archaeon]
MKRKVIQIANSTQLISLPRKWTIQFGIKKGDELEVEERGSKIEISTDRTPELEDIDLNVTNLDRTSTMLYVRSAYRRGFDSVNIRFDKPTTVHYRTNKHVSYISIINTEVNRLVGLEIIKQTENHCVIKDFSGDHSKDFDSLIRKIFLQINDAMNDLVKGAKNMDVNLLETIEEKHDSITKFVSYCLRLLNKKSHYDAYKSHVIYYTIASLDIITDDIKYAAREIIKYNKKFKKESIVVCELIQKALYTFYELFYKYDIKNINNLIRIRDEILVSIDDNANKIPVKELLILNDIKQITNILKDLGEARMELTHTPNRD